MKVSILQHKANPACEFVIMKKGNFQDPWCFLPQGLTGPLDLPWSISKTRTKNIRNIRNLPETDSLCACIRGSESFHSLRRAKSHFPLVCESVGRTPFPTRSVDMAISPIHPSVRCFACKHGQHKHCLLGLRQVTCTGGGEVIIANVGAECPKREFATQIFDNTLSAKYSGCT